MKPASALQHNHGQYSQTETTLESRARSLLASSIRTLGDGTHEHEEFIYPTPCDSVDGVVESTTTLIAARAFSKLGRADFAWKFLRTLFSAQGSHGFLPRYVYLNYTNEETNTFEGCGWDEFVGPYLGPKLFDGAPEEFIPRSSETHGKSKSHSHHKSTSSSEGKVQIWSSNTIMASPHHSTAILEIFYLSNQTNADVANLDFFYQKLLSWHDFLHKRIITNCTGSLASTDSPAGSKTHCFTVRHPWETEIYMGSSLWDSALANVTKVVKEKGWAPNYEIPAAVKSSFDYPGDEAYRSFLYLLQCGASENDSDITKESHEHFHSRCPFQMIDVGFTAALSKADHDLIQIRQILIDKNRIAQPSWEAMETAKHRSRLSRRMLHHLWDDDKGTFFNEVVNLTLNSNVTYSSNYTTPANLPIGSNFLALWDNLSNSTMVESLSSQLLQRSGQFSFYCGDYFSLAEYGGCGEVDASNSPILLLLNYRVSKGLRHNQEFGTSHFLQSSTFNLICGLPNSDESDLNDCLDYEQFATAFNTTSHQPLGEDKCDLASTLTASIVLDTLIPDKAFRYESEPPIGCSSVIVVIAVEMVVAFGVGIACLFLSLNLMRRAKADEEGDEFLQIIREQQQEEELLVQTSLEDADELVENRRGETNDSGAGMWPLGLISNFIPMKLWERHTQTP